MGVLVVVVGCVLIMPPAGGTPPPNPTYDQSNDRAQTTFCRSTQCTSKYTVYFAARVAKSPHRIPQKVLIELNTFLFESPFTVGFFVRMPPDVFVKLFSWVCVSFRFLTGRGVQCAARAG